MAMQEGRRRQRAEKRAHCPCRMQTWYPRLAYAVDLAMPNGGLPDATEGLGTGRGLQETGFPAVNGLMEWGLAYDFLWIQQEHEIEQSQRVLVARMLWKPLIKRFDVRIVSDHGIALDAALDLEPAVDELAIARVFHDERAQYRPEDGEAPHVLYVRGYVLFASS